jgi:exodeoxyribonuclease VII large subunit
VSQPAFDFGDDLVDDAGNPTFTVAELGEAINDSLRRGFRDGVWVRGEITGWHDRGNHAYFTLADDGDDKAVVNVQFFANARMRLRPMLRKHRLRLADGMKVRIFGFLDYYAPTGRVGLKMTGIDPRYTLGDIAQSRDAVLRRLVAEGLLDANRRHELSRLPLRVGVVTSVGSAAWHDFRDELEGSGIGFRLQVVDVRVQGAEATTMVAAAVATLSRDTRLDTLVLIRGGGARNELAVFDAEVIARAIAAAPVPVLTGLGHEVDRSIADEVAHTAAKTPTACARTLIDRVSSTCAGAEETWRAVTRRAVAVLDDHRVDLGERAHRIARRTHAAVERSDERLGVRIDRLGRAAPAVLDRVDAHLHGAARSLRERPPRCLAAATVATDLLAARLAAVDPAVQLARGWSITRRADGTVVRHVGDMSTGEALVTTLVDGTVVSDVRDLQPLPPSASVRAGGDGDAGGDGPDPRPREPDDG